MEIMIGADSSPRDERTQVHKDHPPPIFLLYCWEKQRGGDKGRDFSVWGIIRGI